MKQFKSVFTLLILSVVLLGCSSGGGNNTPSQPILPTTDRIAASPSGGTHLWGLYDFYFDPSSETIEVIPMRGAEMEVNVLFFLEGMGGPPKITIPEIEVIDNKINCTVGLIHPFPANMEYSGFMVRGILLTDGSRAVWEDPNLVMSGPGELQLTNHDGFTRWLNPVEFPYDGSFMNYIPGKLANPDGGSYSSTLNPYKLFADGLDAINDDLDIPNPGEKGVFRASSYNQRRYELDFGTQDMGHWQYAVVASWEFPTNVPPQIPESFPFGTVASEPWKAEVVEFDNSLFYTDDLVGGELILDVNVSDFENIDQTKVFIEAPGIFPRQEVPVLAFDGPNATFETNVSDIVLPNADSFEVLVTAVAADDPGYGGSIPDAETAMYVTHMVDVQIEIQIQNCPDFPFNDDFQSYDCVWTPNGGTWWGVANDVLDAKGGGTCFEENDGSDIQNPNVSYVVSPQITIPDSDQDLLLKFSHTIDVDAVEPLGRWAWDMCYVRVNGIQVYPTGGPMYEDNHIPWSFADIKCWTAYYGWTESEFNLGTGYNGTTIQVEFVLDTFDNINNCDPPYYGWLIDDLTLEHI